MPTAPCPVGFWSSGNSRPGPGLAAMEVPYFMRHFGGALPGARGDRCAARGIGSPSGARDWNAAFCDAFSLFQVKTSPASLATRGIPMPRETRRSHAPSLGVLPPLLPGPPAFAGAAPAGAKEAILACPLPAAPPKPFDLGPTENRRRRSGSQAHWQPGRQTDCSYLR